MRELEMPVPCDECGEWVELNETRESPIKKGKSICRDCYPSHQQAQSILEEIKDIQYMLDNDDETVKGDRRGWKNNIKDLKQQLSELGYDFDELEY